VYLRLGPSYRASEFSLPSYVVELALLLAIRSMPLAPWLLHNGLHILPKGPGSMSRGLLYISLNSRLFTLLLSLSGPLLTQNW
jgi:hypothetical protein